MPASVTSSADLDDPPRQPRGPLAIGPWIVDPPINELRRGNEAVRIEPKAMDVLVFLADRAGRLVSREELFAAAWPGVVVGDEALTQTINKLRKAFGDASRSPSYIETIAKRGYRLIADVRPWQAAGAISGPAAAGATSGQASVEAAPSSSPPARKHWRAMTLLGLAAMAIAIAAAISRSCCGRQQRHGRASTRTHSASRDGSASPSHHSSSLGGDPEQAYLARGITVSLVTDLSRLSDLRVIRLPDHAPADRDAPGVHYRMTGSVQRDAGSLRVTVSSRRCANG
jgi:DNA-binding winged helix-turn-helix (wHTH) protein